jgi:DHA2 family multidrug resistance protein
LSDATRAAGDGRATAGRSGEETPWIIAPVVAMAAFMEVLDISIANVSLQHIAGSLAASQDQSTWILTSYLVTNAIVLPISGWLATVIGRKRLYMGCIAGFGFSSLLCGMAPSLGLLIAFRAVQGLTGGGLQPMSQAILADAFPPRHRGMAFAFYGIAVVFAPAIGPTLGGWITDNFSWHWVFLINVPVSIVLFSLIGTMISDPPHLVEERRSLLRRGVRFDYLGFAFLTLGLGFLQVVLDKGQQEDWFGSHFILVASVISAAALVAFVPWELQRKDPIVDLSLLKNRNFAAAVVLMFMLGFVLLGSTAMIPLLAQDLLGYTATLAGLVISPGGFAIMALMPVVGRLVTAVDSRWLIAFGLAVSSYALYRMTHLNTQVDYWTLAIDRIIQTSGLAFLFIPINTTAYVGLPLEKNNTASALINLARNLGGSVGIAALTTLIARRTQFHRNILVSHLSADDPQYRALVDQLQARMAEHGASAGEAVRQAQEVLARQLHEQAQMLSYIDAFFVLAVIFACLIPLVFLMRRPPPHPPGAPG